ncbi:MAG: DUF4345 family protein [Marivita sp.]|uniref:DUF4345 family protein n=1 Tax=Marivita sp. TaxID=2003365 RepID=UPI003EF826AF
MIDIVNSIAAVLTIALGAFGFLAPRYTAEVLDLRTGATTMGLSEMRASVGGLFVVAGAACLWLNMPVAYVMLGFVYLGASAGRALSLVLDAPPLPKALVYFLVEAVLAAWLLIANLGGVHGVSQ